MKCKRCGQKITADIRFCPECGAEVTVVHKNKPGKSQNSLYIAAIAIVIMLGIGIAAILGVRNLNSFTAHIKSFQSYCSQYKLGDLTTEYEELIDRAKDAAASKNKEQYHKIETEFETFKKTLAAYIKEVDSFSGKEEEYQAMFEKINLNDVQKSTYQTSIDRLKNGQKEGSLSQMKEAVSDLDSQYQQYENENLALIEADRQRLDHYISTELLSAEQQLVRQYKNNADNFLNEKNYRSVLEEYEKCITLYQNIEKSLGYQFKVEQVDALSFPNIKLYVSAYPNQSDISVNLQNNGLLLRELMSDIYQDTEITKVSRLDEKEKLNTCLVADVSGSMYDQIGIVKDAMSQFVNCMQYSVGDRCALITFDNTVNLDKDFTGNAQELVNVIQNLYVGNCTALYDALYVAVCKAAEEDGAKCVIAFTDGYDNVSTKTENDVISIAQMYGIPVYLIGIGDEADPYTLQQISNATGGYYYNIYDGSMMQEIYNSIYKKNKELYLIEYTTRITDKNTFQNLYLTYDDGTVFMRCESEFQPAQLLTKEQEYTSIIQNTGIDNSDIENEVLRIRSVYNDIVAKRDVHSYTESSPAAGVTSYHENGNLRCVIVNKGINNSPYTRYYYYDGGKLIFAYLESDDSHRLYFKNDKMFRWRYASNAVAFSEADNHDNEDSAEFRTWETFALNEAYSYN